MKPRKQPHNKLRTCNTRAATTHCQQQQQQQQQTNKLDAAAWTERVTESFTYSIIAEKYVEHLGVRC